MTPGSFKPRVYHIVHVDRLTSIATDGVLWSDSEAQRRQLPGTVIGMNEIKQRRLTELKLKSRPGLFVGQCVPFYFCPRSVMLYLIFKSNNPRLAYRGGQEFIVHLVADLRESVAWAEEHKHRWAFTTSNAGSYHFRDYSDLGQLGKIDWEAVQARDWSRQPRKENKQAEFLVERSFSWSLIQRIGTLSADARDRARASIRAAAHRPAVEVQPSWHC